MAFVIILTGGNSSEREICLRSGTAIQNALIDLGHKVKMIDYNDDIEDYKNELVEADVVIPALHGKGGEDGTLQAKLESLDVCFVGSNSVSSALCMDKWQYKLHIKNEILTADGELFDMESLWNSKFINKPFVIKPNDGGSSIDTFIVKDIEKIDREKISEAFSRNDQMLIEELISGIEITAGVLGNKSLPIVEIIPPADSEFDYENKYNGKTKELCPPANISIQDQEKAQNIALKTHQLCGCRDLSRTDMIVTPTGKIYVIETNTFPGMTDQSLFPKEAAVDGIQWNDLVEQLIDMAMERLPNI
jgi:D-alanine-D-alanine ligase